MENFWGEIHLDRTNELKKWQINPSRVNVEVKTPNSTCLQFKQKFGNTHSFFATHLKAAEFITIEVLKAFKLIIRVAHQGTS